MERNGDKKLKEFADKFFIKFEIIMSVILSLTVAVLVFIAMIRILYKSYQLVISDIADVGEITYEDYNTIFGSIMTLLIGLEFMKSIIDMIHKRGMKSLATQVALITALALARKLIILDYSHYDPMLIFAMGFILMALAVFYFLIKQSDIKKVIREVNHPAEEK